jgi:hypothetical protein
MVTKEAVSEFKKMWTWLYRHPAHDQKYYIKHVAKADQPWKNDCPLCHLSEGECRECLALWDKGNGTLCEDPGSPLSQWRGTHLNNPNFRMWYAGKLADMAHKYLQ